MTGTDTFPHSPFTLTYPGRHAPEWVAAIRRNTRPPSAEYALARELIERVSFCTGHYSRSWEISSDHLNTPAFTYLVEQAEIPVSNGLFFDIFRLETEYSCIGCKLLCTPWTDDGLADHGLTPKALREEQLAAGVPEALVDLLHLAAQADARFLIFDANAPALEGLPLRSEGDYA